MRRPPESKNHNHRGIQLEHSLEFLGARESGAAGGSRYFRYRVCARDLSRVSISLWLIDSFDVCSFTF